MFTLKGASVRPFSFASSGALEGICIEVDAPAAITTSSLIACSLSDLGRNSLDVA